MISKHVFLIMFLNELDFIFLLHTVRWFEVFLSNKNNPTYY